MNNIFIPLAAHITYTDLVINDSDIAIELKSAPFDDDLSYAQIQVILSRFMDAATDWHQSLEIKRSPSSDQLREFLNATLEAGQALKLHGSSESHIALRVQLARLACIAAEIESSEEVATSPGVASAFLDRLDWPELFSALDASFDLIPKIIFDQVAHTQG